MAAISVDPSSRLNNNLEQVSSSIKNNNHGVVVIEEVEGLIRVYRNGHVERPPAIPNVHCAVPSHLGVIARDISIDKYTNLWARIYVPNSSSSAKLPFLLYFHGGGFCIGSAAWSCYHDFLANLSSKAGCVIMSINYRLAPETRLPGAYEDGISSLMWVKQQALNGSSEHKWWINKCNLSSMFVAGDSAGGNIAYNVTTRLVGSNYKPLCVKGTILIQPFFGGEARIGSEKQYGTQQQMPNSALTLSASDTYWRLSLPLGANRDHPWCNPLGSGNLRVDQSIMVCISEMDILKDRNLEFCSALATAGKRVEKVVYKGVGHAFQVLHNSRFSQMRTQEMMSHLNAFINQ
ncbi:hypothetical protein LWI29_035646 [Acer saccharum]|uniref:Alpha/beta hydrolase fold-3 domain-containing protein n=1 Tax=Acer saccharum TaxID=4024 RepID=A0AA39VMT2_ACESA|nr:hypothetical protein LWI29_035646 [Acer saccharum]